jgi:two-component system, OmpR family, sensor histidine kinase CpxA
MRRLHVKIFLWFWVGVVVMSATLVMLTELSHPRGEDDTQWREKYAPRVDMWSRQESGILRREGTAGLERYVASIQFDPGVINYVFDDRGNEVLNRAPSEPVKRMAASMAGVATGTQRIDPDERIIAERVVDARGAGHVMVVDYPGPSVLNRSVLEFFSADRYPQATAGRLFAVVMVAGVLCFFLARHLARPIEQLQLATRHLATEQLQTRVDPSVLDRRDELADLGRDFDRMAERIEDLVTAQRHLLADVSHALRSPLARLNLALGLARQRGAESTTEHLDRIELETERLNRLIGQLLTMARVDSGVDVEHATTFDLGSVVEEVSTDANYEASHRESAVRFEQHRTCLVSGARELLRGAVENVVRNAVRHTAVHTDVEVSMDRRDADDGSWAVIQVRDHGPGVPGEAVGGLFTPFHRVVNGYGSNGEGTGLGLAITRRTFEVHGGRANAANAPDGGFVVTLELPMPVGQVASA